MSLPLVTRFGADPLLDLEIANKRYVDNASSSGGAFAILVKPADEIRANDNVFSNDDTMFFAAAANKTYFIISHYTYVNPVTTTAGFKYLVSVPTGATAIMTNGGGLIFRGSTLSAFNADATNSTAKSGVATAFGVGNLFAIKMGSTAGTVAMQWAQNSSNADGTVLEEGSSWIVYESS